MSIVNGTSRGGIYKLCLSEKFWLFKRFNDENLLNKKSDFISKCRHEKKLLVKSVKKRKEKEVLFGFILCYHFSFCHQIFCISFLEN